LDAPNPGEQPTASEKCPAGAANCNAYKIMRDAGFTDAGPDASEASSYTWGLNALLTGADPKRKAAATAMGNSFGFTDRLDYIFVKNGIDVATARTFGQGAPYGSDHAGVIAELNVTALGSVISEPLDAHRPFPISFWEGVGILLLALVTWRIVRRFRRR
jgi:hypothetical protein